MARNLQLNNAANWQEVYTNAFLASIKHDGSHKPIPVINIPLMFESQVIAVYVTTSIPENRNWISAGYLYQKVRLGLLINGSVDTESSSTYRLGINRIKLIVFPKITVQYSVSIKLPVWFKTAIITLWSYTGIDSESTDDLIIQLQADVARLEQKIDSLI